VVGAENIQPLLQLKLAWILEFLTDEASVQSVEIYFDLDLGI
jgi:hypothetical protein